VSAASHFKDEKHGNCIRDERFLGGPEERFFNFRDSNVALVPAGLIFDCANPVWCGSHPSLCSVVSDRFALKSPMAKGREGAEISVCACKQTPFGGHALSGRRFRSGHP
jgi:hypothetical protein